MVGSGGGVYLDARYSLIAGETGGDQFADVWPAERQCITVTRPDTSGLPAGHGCKCRAVNCNYDLCSAANSANPPAMISLSVTECRTINCQLCIFPFLYLGVEHSQCTTVDSDNGAPWCAVDVGRQSSPLYLRVTEGTIITD